MSTLMDTWNMYMGLKDRRRQKEQDELNLEKYEYQKRQDSLANSQRKRQLDNADRNYEAARIDQAALESERAKGWDEKNQIIVNEAYGDLKRNIMKNHRQSSNNANGTLNKQVNFNSSFDDATVRDNLNRIYKNDARVLAAIQGRNPNVESVAGIEFMEYDSGDGETSTKAVMMLNMKDGTKKPLSQRGGRDDAVVAMDPKEIFEFTDGILVGAADTVNTNDSLQQVAAGSYPDSTGAVSSGTGGLAGTGADTTATGTDTPLASSSATNAPDVAPANLSTASETNAAANAVIQEAPRSITLVEHVLNDPTKLDILDSLSTAERASLSDAEWDAMLSRIDEETLKADRLIASETQQTAESNALVSLANNPALAAMQQHGVDQQAPAGIAKTAELNDRIKQLSAVKEKITAMREAVALQVEEYAPTEVVESGSGIADATIEETGTSPTETDITTEARVDPASAAKLSEQAKTETVNTDAPAKSAKVDQAKVNITKVAGTKTKTKKAIGTAYDRALDMQFLKDGGYSFTEDQVARYVATGSISAPVIDKVFNSRSIENEDGQWLINTFSSGKVQRINLGAKPKTDTEKRAASKALFETAMIGTSFTKDGDDAPFIAKGTGYQGYLETFMDVHSVGLKNVFGVDVANMDAGDRSILAPVLSEVLDQAARNGWNDEVFTNKTLDFAAIVAGFKDRMHTDFFVIGPPDAPIIRNAAVRAKRQVEAAKANGDVLDYNIALQRERERLKKEEAKFNR